METMALAMVLAIDASFGHSRIPSGILHANGKKKSRLKCAARTTSSEALLARDDLLNLIAGEERGLKTQGNSSKCSQITRAIDALAVFGEDSVTTDASLSATWRMLWTTEKEQLFIVEKAHVFGTKVGDILQAIDVEKGSLNNVITFPPSGAFVVSSTIQIASPKRVNFRFTSAVLRGSNWKIPLPPFGQGWFTSAVLRGSNWKIPLPPFGQGWFESLYLDEKIRIAKDIRGDYLVVDRASYTWEDQ